MKDVGLRLICEGAKKQNRDQNEKSADLKDHTRRLALKEAARCRFVLPCCWCGALNHSFASSLVTFSKRQIAWELASGQFKNA